MQNFKRATEGETEGKADSATFKGWEPKLCS